MSEEININAHNLSTPEDVFEKFQAATVSTFEDEDEFITLSDIVPPQPSVPDLSEELNEIPYDNEVVLSSTYDDINSNTYDGCDAQNSYDNSNGIQNDGIPRNIEIMGTEHDGINMNEYEIGGRRELNETLIQDSVLSTTVDQVNSTETSDISTYPRRTKRARISNSSKYVLSNTVTKTNSSGKKRVGRPKKSGNDTPIEPDSTNTETTLQVNTHTDSIKPEKSEPIQRKQSKKMGSNKKQDANKCSIKGRRGRPRARNVSPNKNNVSKNGITEPELPQPVLHESSLPTEKNVENNAPIVTLNAEKNENPESKDNSDEDGDDICLSKLKEKPEYVSLTKQKETLTSETENQINDCKISSEKELNADELNAEPATTEMEHIEEKLPAKNADLNNTDSINQLDDSSLLIEDTSKRPMRMKAKKSFHYEEDSDEDPFANMGSTDEEDNMTVKKGKKNYSDDEYVPTSKSKQSTQSSNSDSEELAHEELDETLKKRKRLRKKSNNLTPRKRGKKSHDDELSPDVTIVCSGDETKQKLQPETKLDGVKSKAEETYKRPAEAWATSNEFENFIVQKIQNTNTKIQKVHSKEKSENHLAPLDIPIIDQNTTKCVETSTQTELKTKSVSLQTTPPYDIPMKTNMKLSKKQSESACQFLNGIVQTTVELGQLMSQKSEDFMKKKINTNNITDTFKMDYCVRKSFLLFKLAKHNLMQMEDDLAKQYDEFLKNNNLSSCRESIPAITANSTESDSDCEIVGEEKILTPLPGPSKKKPGFNPKTVFLNKELSIKIAKKPPSTTSTSATTAKKLDIKSRHAVWINDSVMVKKVKPNQSFLAQDSRNKKPPDTFVTEKMVSDFFKDYNRQKAINVCAPFISKDWLHVQKVYACHYFVQFEDFETASSNNIALGLNVENTDMTSDRSSVQSCKITSNPKSLFMLCLDTIYEIFDLNQIKTNSSYGVTDNKKEPVSLFRQCMKILTCPTSVTPVPIMDINNSIETNSSITKPLKTLCYEKILKLIDRSKSSEIYQEASSEMEDYEDFSMNDIVKYDKFEYVRPNSNAEKHNTNYNPKPLLTMTLEMVKEVLIKESPSYIGHSNKYVKSLLTLSLEMVQTTLKVPSIPEKVTIGNISTYSPPSLKYMAYKTTTELLFCDVPEEYSCSVTSPLKDNNEMDNFTINCVNTLTDEAFKNLQDPDEEELTDYSECLEDGGNFDGEYQEWDSQTVEQELSSCLKPTNAITESTPHNENESHTEEAQGSIISQIKIEPIEEYSETLDSSIVKTEPVHEQELDVMTLIPDSIITKKELIDQAQSGSPDIRAVATCDVDSFENFVRCNKMIHALDEENDNNIFSQSTQRIRRQHEPDFDTDNDMMSLLIPQTYEPLHVENAKGSLMDSSSESESCDPKKNSKKRAEKKKKMPKKDVKSSKSKDVSKSKTSSEVAILTRKMRDKIRQEEKNNQSSESESEILTNIKKNKNSKTNNVTADNEIQCSNVDSTENLLDKSENNIEKNKFSGFTAIDQNEITSYQKYMKYVYDKIVPDENEDVENNARVQQTENEKTNKLDSRPDSPVICPSGPVELLECEPTLPYQYNEPKTLNDIDHVKNQLCDKINKPEVKYIEKHGWHCYPFEVNDIKLSQNPQIILEKLPETFVETYLQYQEIISKDDHDDEVNRLINLQSLNRGKDVKSKTRFKFKPTSSEPIPSTSRTRSPSPAGSEHLSELTPSEDEETKIEDEIPPPLPLRSSENVLAKNLLMDDNDSDSEFLSQKKIKKEAINEEGPTRPGPKSKTKVNSEVDPESLMLTADKMMNKELKMLHAPVVISDEASVQQYQSVEEKPTRESRQNKKKENKNSTKQHDKFEDHSSSEEEKQWVTTKEKLLKRLDKKEKESVDDAKKVKLVNEFIEKRNEDKGRKMRSQGRRSRKKFLERQKQLRVLSNELYGEGSVDAGHVTKRSGNILFKGRRNIRKVIDKKSLARSTVLANMEEFERKRRINMRLQKLREITGCEEDVNVLVINNELCLEYDFEQHCPAVTVHQFFTKVMKAHQYEGVKFMWDACFESLESVESGHPGSGCILAHCMGLGKTLQVLALLHTVLTHPRVGMKRVLVCCPLSTVLNWVDEIHKWLGPVTNEIKVFELSKLRKTYERAYQLEDWYNGGGIFIIGYELFRSLTTLDPFIDDIRPTIVNKIRKALLDPGPDIIICDEGHLLKNDCSVLAVAMSRVVTKRRIVLTGTPMQNNLREYYCMVNFVKPNLLGTYAEYSNRFENPIMNGQHRDSREEDIKLMKARTHILHKVLEGCLQRQEASVLYPYLPKKHEYTVFISLTKCQWDLYKHYLNNYSNRNKQSVLKDFHILQKIWSHPQVLHKFQTKARDSSASKIKSEKIEDDLALEDKEDIKPADTEVWWLQFLDGGNMLDSLDSSNKFVTVFKILHECVELGDKVLIFSTSLFTLDALEYFLKRINNWNLGHEYYRLDGSVPAEVRQKWCREFNAENNKKTKLFLISTRAGCLGLNMTAANRVIILDTSWNPAHDIQSIFRVYRFGQKKDCYIYRLVAMGTMEQKIYERSVTKQAVACRVVDEQQIDRHYNMAELNELYKFDESGAQVAGGVAAGVCDVALLRVARDAALHAVHEHDSLLRGGAEPALPEHERAAAWRQFQQEHAHKQMQNEIDARAEAGEAAPGPSAPAEGAPPKKSESRSRRPRRGESAPPPAPPASAETDLDMVQRITRILVEHDFGRGEAGPQDIGELVERVRRTVTEGGAGPADPDRLTASIARVLLRYSTPAPHAATPEAGAGAGAQATPPRPPDVDPESGGSRQPALAAAGRGESPPVIDLDDEEWNAERAERGVQPAAAPVRPARLAAPRDEPGGGVEESRRSEVSLTDDGPPSKPAPPDSKKKYSLLKKDRADRSRTHSIGPKSKRKRILTQESDDSIVLSDDEVGSIETNSHPPPIDVARKMTEKIPLHTSLLTNNNFIKIVAHTYLSGNPMLDEDAAVLAAQYSTLKAVKEVESTGKEIVDGPIYDIAVKVLGMDVLKRLYDSKHKDSNVATELQSALGGSSKSAIKESNKPLSNPAPKLAIQYLSRVQSKHDGSTNSTIKSSKTPIASPKSALQHQTNTTRESDVNIAFKILDNGICLNNATPAHKEECILPDTAADPSLSSEHLVGSKSKPKVGHKPTANNKPAIDNNSNTSVHRPSPSGEGSAPHTICLDSDDEEPVPVALSGPAPAAAPHPVRLTCVGKGPPPASSTKSPQTIRLSFVPRPHATDSQRNGPFSKGPDGPVPDTNVLLLPMKGANKTIIKLAPIRLDRVDPASPIMIPDQVAQAKAVPHSRPDRTVSVSGDFATAVRLSTNSSVAGPTPPENIASHKRPNRTVSSSNRSSISASLPTNQTEVVTTPNGNVVKTSSPSIEKGTPCSFGDLYRISSTGRLEIVRMEKHSYSNVTPEPKKDLDNKLLPSTSSVPQVASNKPQTSASSIKNSTKTYCKKGSSKIKDSDNSASKLVDYMVSKPPERNQLTQQVNKSSDKQSTIELDSRKHSSANYTRDDPLEILKDVVHIQAPTLSSTCQSTKPTVSGPLISKDNLKSKRETKIATPNSLEKNDIKLKYPKTSADSKMTKAPENRNLKLRFLKTTVKESIDLTNLEPVASTSKTRKPTEKMNTIVISKLNTKQQKSHPVQDFKNINILPKPKVAEKRAAPPVKTENKKPKSSLLTLKDFDIDDIDDIIELD